MSNESWVKKKIEGLTRPEFTAHWEPLSKIQPHVYYEVGSWTPLKLICLAAYINTYTTIISGRYPQMYYIDLLAGPGINKVRETEDIIPGSPLIAAFYPSKPFTKLIFVEKDKVRSSALQERLSTLIREGKGIVYQEKDCNDAIGAIAKDYLSLERSHYLAFVDCEGLDIHWETMKKLLDYKGDVIFTFPAGVERVEKEAEKLKKFYGEHWKKAKESPDRYEYYKSMMIAQYRDVVKDIRIKGGLGSKSFSYNLIFATRTTRGGSAWMRVVDYLKGKIEKHTGDDVKHALEIVKGKATSLDLFLTKTEKKTTQLKLSG